MIFLFVKVVLNGWFLISDLNGFRLIDLILYIPDFIRIAILLRSGCFVILKNYLKNGLELLFPVGFSSSTALQCHCSYP